MSRSGRYRVLRRAVAAWQAGKPHQAWQLLHDAGMDAYWPAFQRAAFKRARTRYTRTMARYQA